VDLTVSRPIKLLALVGVLVAVGGYASMTMLNKGGSSATASPPVPSVAQLRAQRTHAAAAAKAAQQPATKAKATPAKTSKAHAKPVPAAAGHPATTTTAVAPAATRTTTPAATATTPRPATTAAAAAEKAPTVTASGLPIPLADALRQHRIVVVSIFDPESQTDAISYAEARAGAADAGAGFLGVSVLDDSLAGPLTALLPGGGLLPDPGILVYRRPGLLVLQIAGFADRESVAQAAAAAVTATPAAAPATAAPVTSPAPDTLPVPTTTTG
jgi:hypothetical protein